MQAKVLNLFIFGMALGAHLRQAEAQDFVPPDRPPPESHQVQGEYLGTVEGGEKLGAWVVAQGGDNFSVVFLKGGLLDIPGQSGGGWDRTTKFTGTGTILNLTTTQGYKGAIAGAGENRVLTGTAPDGKKFSLNRILRNSPTLGLAPKPEWNATHWFRANNAADLANWSPRPSAPQLKYGGYLFRGVTCKLTHGTTYLHIEVRSPFCPTCRGQTRGNSGIYLRGMHEMQVLDSFGLSGLSDELGGIYKVKEPLVNAALPPLTWQTYDCYYKVEPGANTATMTVYLNGVLVQDKTRASGITQAGFSGSSLYLQDHGSEVTYGNIWAVAGATEESLPWATVMEAALPTTGVEARAGLLQVVRPRLSLDLFGFGEDRDLMGRQVAGVQGKSRPLVFPTR